MLGFDELVRRFKQRFGRDTAYVQAGAAVYDLTFFTDPFFNTGGFQTQLRSANSRYVATRACTDNDHVKLVSHVGSFSLVASSRWDDSGKEAECD